MRDYSWSYSAFSSAVRCLREFKLAYIDRLDLEQPDQGDLIFGTTVHAAINAALRGKDGEQVFDGLWETYRGADVAYGRFCWEELSRIGSTFLAKFTKFHLKHYDLQSAETRMYGVYSGIRIEGTPDFIGSYKGRRALRDFKTSSRNYEKEKSLVALQLHLYAELARQNGFDYPATLGYTMLNKAVGSIQDLTWEFDLQGHTQILEQFRLYIDSLMSGVTALGLQNTDMYPQNPNACLFPRRCKFFDVCHNKKESE